MTYFLVLLLVALVATIMALRANQPWARPALLALVVVGIGFGLLSTVRSCRTTNPAVGRLVDEVTAARVLGGLIAKDFPGATLLVISAPPANERGEDLFSTSRTKGLKEGLGQSTRKLLRAGPTPTGLASTDPEYTALPAENFEAELRRWHGQHTDAKAIVSLLPLAPNYRTTIPLYAFFAGRDDSWADGLRSGTIKAAILYRPPPLPANLTPETNDGLPPKFKLVTKDNLEAALKELGL